MRRHERIDALREALSHPVAAGATIGFVPTMGYLHEGHLSLVRAARRRCDRVVVSIFVNPAQFGPTGGDLARYPRDLARDAALLEPEGVDELFTPDAGEIYPPGYRTWVEVEDLTRHLDGGSRPGYFRGICTVVLKLFHIVRPDVAFFGQKDLQQALVIRRMARDLHLETVVEMMPTVREPDGLAMSSRNTYLSPDDRAVAPAIHDALDRARRRHAAGERDAESLKRVVRDRLAREPRLVIDYVEVVDLDAIRPVATVDDAAAIAVACDLAGTRLIDNVLLGEGPA